MIIVGIDPGLGKTGVAALHIGGGNAHSFFDVAAFSSKAGGKLEERVHLLSSEVMGYLADACLVSADGYQAAGAVAIEENYVAMGKSTQSALKQRELIGTIAASCYANGVTVVRVSPGEAKKIMAGKGNANKDAMVESAEHMADLSRFNKAEREAIADAMGIALAAAKRMAEEAELAVAV